MTEHVPIIRCIGQVVLQMACQNSNLAVESVELLFSFIRRQAEIFGC